MASPQDQAFSQRMHAAFSPVTERYVVESGRPDKVFAAPFDPNKAILDFTETRFSARPVPLIAEKACRFAVSKVVGIPQEVFDDVLVPAFDERAEEIIDSRLRRPMVQLTDHNPNLLSVATQFAENLAIARRLVSGNGDSAGRHLRGMIERSEGIGTVGYRALGVHLFPGVNIMFGTLGRAFTATNYSIPSTPQYRELPNLNKDDNRRYNGIMVINLLPAMQDAPKERVPSRGELIVPAHLYKECVISPVGTKELKEDGQIVIPAAQKGTGMLLEALSPNVTEVYTSFRYDANDKIVGAECEIGEVLDPPEPGQGMNAINAYLARVAAFRTARESIPVVYAGAA